MTQPVLSVRDLSVAFFTRRGVLKALDRVSFDIAPGEVLGVVGESGAGKSLTGQSVIGLLEPPGRITGGEILLHGQRIDNIPADEMPCASIWNIAPLTPCAQESQRYCWPATALQTPRPSIT